MQNIPNEDREAVLAKMDTNELIAEVRRLWKLYTPKGEPMDLEAIERHISDMEELGEGMDRDYGTQLIAEIRRLRSSPERDLTEAKKEANLIDACTFFGIDTLSTGPEAPEKDLGREGNKDLTATPQIREPTFSSPSMFDYSKETFEEILKRHSAHSPDLAYDILRRYEFLRSEILSAPPVGPSPMEVVWQQLKDVLGTDGWSVGDSFMYRSFFKHGWDAAIKGTAKESPKAQEPEESPKLREWVIAIGHGFYDIKPEFPIGEYITVREVPQSKGEATR